MTGSICPNCGFQTFKQQNHYFLFIQTSTSSICRYIQYTHMHKSKHLLERASQSAGPPGGGRCRRHIPGYWGGTEAPAPPVHWTGSQTPERKLYRSPLSFLQWEWGKAENTALTLLSNSSSFAFNLLPPAKLQTSEVLSQANSGGNDILIRLVFLRK